MADSQWSQWHACIDFMKADGVEFEVGMTDAEFEAAEKRFEFRFPPDLRASLSVALPVKHKEFPNWRDLDCEDLSWKFNLPLDGILFDVEQNNFWLTKWGPKPPDIADAKMLAKEKVKAAPKLIPICSHRLMPESPHQSGNPVFSVHQTDIIYYGINLRDYLIHEFATPSGIIWPIPDDVTEIEFWDDIVLCRGWSK